MCRFPGPTWGSSREALCYAPVMRRQRPEQQVHRAVVAHLKARGERGVVFLHPANGGARPAVEASIMTGLGVVPGAPDLLLWHEGKSFALELKAARGRISEAQAEMLARLSDAGVFTAVCHGVDRAVAVLETWGLLRGTASLGQRSATPDAA
jgi:VRR-NUC domain